jgi:hypothetical protein
MGDIFLLSLLAAFNPTLIAVTTLLLMLENPKRLMLGYLLGAMMTSITLGFVIVFALEGSGTLGTTQHTLSPAADIALGAIMLTAAIVLRGDRGARRRRRADAHKQPPRWQRTLSKGSPRAAFVVGALLTLPGASYLAGLNRIDRGNYSTATTVALIIAFNVIMLALLEVPLLSFVIAPSWTPGAVERGKAWALGRVRRIAVTGLTVVGSALVIKGVVGLFT